MYSRAANTIHFHLYISMFLHDISILPKGVTMRVWISVGTLYWRTCSIREEIQWYRNIYLQRNSQWHTLIAVNGKDKIFRVTVKDLSGIQTDPKLALVLGEVYSGVKPDWSFATVFQADVLAIMAAICESIARGYNGRTITIFTGSQAALKILESVIIKSKQVLECLECLSELATHSSVQLVWVPGHEGILGNERTDELVRRVQTLHLLDPSPYLAYHTVWSSEQSGTGWRGNT